MHYTYARPRAVALLAGVLASALLVFGLGTPRADAGPVLANDFGKMKSHIVGTFGKNGSVVGTFTPRRFVTNGSTMDAVGVLKATLIRGITGRYKPLSCGASCSPPSIAFKTGGVTYTFQATVGTQKTERARLIKMANDAIRKGPR